MGRPYLWDLLAHLLDRSQFSGHPDGLSIRRYAAREWESGFSPSGAPTTQIGSHLRQWPSTFQSLCRGVFLQSWIGIGFCYDPPAQKRQTAQSGDTRQYSAAKPLYFKYDNVFYRG